MKQQVGDIIVSIIFNLHQVCLSLKFSPQNLNLNSYPIYSSSYSTTSFLSSLFFSSPFLSYLVSSSLILSFHLLSSTLTSSHLLSSLLRFVSLYFSSFLFLSIFYPLSSHLISSHLISSSFLSFPFLSCPIFSFFLPSFLLFSHPLCSIFVCLATDAASSSGRSRTGDDDWLERPGKVYPSSNKNFGTYNNGKSSSNVVDNGTSVYHDANYVSANIIYNKNGTVYNNDNNNNDKYKDGGNVNDGKSLPRKLPPTPGIYVQNHLISCYSVQYCSCNIYASLHFDGHCFFFF